MTRRIPQLPVLVSVKVSVRVSVVVSVLALTLVTACETTAIPQPDLGRFSEPALVRTSANAPPGAAPGSCWGREVSPAIVESVTEQIVVQPAEVLTDGTVVKPAVYRTEIRQQIVRERRETWFETPCAPVLTREFIASLQRALAVRKLYRGPVSGEMDSRTRAAIRRYQKPEGLDSGILSLETARRLGLVAVANP